MGLMTKKEAAAFLKVSTRTFDTYREKYPDALEAMLIGGTVPRWYEDQIRAFAESQRGGWSSKGGRRVA
jgi:hypothetical protein